MSWGLDTQYQTERRRQHTELLITLLTSDSDVVKCPCSFHLQLKSEDCCSLCNVFGTLKIKKTKKKLLNVPKHLEWNFAHCIVSHTQKTKQEIST